ncbi:MAG: diadenylate cyclase CdaA [Erysipelotrichaceae bacterium]|nr:diadenylate cyclase CdaA [Erysipelotrichaceae bacterium]MBR3150602.1 diadenylate cyclase CdaA [Erysipelotrichaceae bacterium]MBR3168718.1 diadenylate cyclase CdaA [Erysipelotrichaceae bacterium]MCR5300206.1 diadenylate cyclase CdaA [Erysipelotrichaceae bacterium]
MTLQSIWAISRIFFDVAIMWFLIYYAMKFVRNNARTIQIFKGIILILLVNALAKLLRLSTVAYFSDLFINWGFLAAIIIFQPEIRGLLERIGKTNALSSISSLLMNEKEKLVEEIYEAVIALSKNRVGALITIEQSQSLQDYVRSGLAVNASVTKELLSSIFMTTTPLHDGAVIIQGDKIACASTYFPPTNAELSSRYGARHRAALGIAEITDALTIVVSEETSGISIAEKGKIFAVDEQQLRDYLRRVICNDEIEIRRQSRQRSSLLITDEPEMIVEKEKDSASKKNLFAFFAKKNKEAENADSETTENPKTEIDMKIPVNNRLKYDEQHPTVIADTEEDEMKAPEAEDTYVEEAIDITDNTQSFEKVKEGDEDE